MNSAASVLTSFVTILSSFVCERLRRRQTKKVMLILKKPVAFSTNLIPPFIFISRLAFTNANHLESLIRFWNIRPLQSFCKYSFLLLNFSQSYRTWRRWRKGVHSLAQYQISWHKLKWYLWLYYVFNLVNTISKDLCETRNRTIVLVGLAAVL